MHRVRFHPAHVDGQGDPLHLAGPAFTWLDDDGKVIACGGVVVLWDGVGEAWFLPTERTQKHARALIREIRHLFLSSSFRRIHADINANKPRNQKWAEVIGFMPEAEMASYLPDGSDAIRYVFFMEPR